jgi:hypothetical protein
MMFTPKNKMFDQPEANKHYIDLGKLNTRRRAVTIIRKKYEQVINDIDFLNEVRNNAFQWYNENIYKNTFKEWDEAINKLF